MDKDFNKLYLQGKIISKIPFAKNMILTEIFITENVFIKVMFKENKTKLLDEYKIGEYINVTAHLRTAQVNRNERYIKENRYIAEDVNKIISIADVISVENKNSHPLTFSEFHVKGEVVQLSKLNNGTNRTYILIKTEPEKGNFNYYISLCVFSTNLNIIIGKKYDFTGDIQTWIDKKDGKRTTKAENVVTNIREVE